MNDQPQPDATDEDTQGHPAAGYADAESVAGAQAPAGDDTGGHRPERCAGSTAKGG